MGASSEDHLLTLHRRVGNVL